MFTYQYTAFIFFFWIILWTSAKPVTKKDSSNEEPNGLSEKEKGSQEDIMFGNQQNKPAGMVDDILSFPENADGKKPPKNSSNPKSESGSVQEKEGTPKHNSMSKDYDYDMEDGSHKYRLPSIPASNLMDDYPLYEDDGSLFRNKRGSMRLRNELEDLLSGRQRRGLRLKREVDIPSLLRNLPPEEIIRFLPDFMTEDSDVDENQKFHPNSYYLMDDPSDDAFWLENMPDRMEVVSQGNKFRQPYISLPKRNSPYIYTPGNVIVLPSEQDTWSGRMGGSQPRGLRRRRPLTIEDDNEEDDHLYDFLGIPERDFPDDL